MFRNTYDGDNTTFSPQGRLHQIEYAQEAVKQGSAAVGLRSNTHAVLLTLARSTGELATYQKKLLRIDDHVGVAIAGLTSDARVLSNFMRQLAMQSKMLYARPIPVARIVNAIADRAQTNTQQYGKRPYGVGFLVIGQDETGPHLFEFSPAGVAWEYYAHSIGARSQSAKTYLEDNAEKFADCSLDELIQHGLNALRDTLQQDKTLTKQNTSIAIIGSPTPAPSTSTTTTTTTTTTEPAIPALGINLKPTTKKTQFRTFNEDVVEPYLQEMNRRMDVKKAEEIAAEGGAATVPAGGDGEAAAAAPPATGEGEAAAATTGAGEGTGTGEGGAPPAEGGNAPGAADGDGDVNMQ